MSRHWRWILAALLLALTVLGLSRLRFEADVFSLLPEGSSMVEGLELYQRSFGAAQELMLSVRAPEPAAAEDAARRLAADLEAAGLAGQVVWRSPLAGDPAELAEILAWLWLNQPPDDFAEFAARFSDDRRAAVLDESLERLAISFEPREVARLSRDPYGLTDLVGQLAETMGQGGQATADPFVAPDGQFRVLFVPLPEEVEGFFAIHEWVEEIRLFVGDWQGAEEGEVAVRVTGNPAFVSEFGSGLLGDMEGAALGTLFLVALLFWLMHRRFKPLLWLVALLLAVLTVTAALGGLVLGTLNAVSLGFAAILLGLATDYGLILYQEWAAHRERSLAELRTAVAPSILWAAVTTAGAFFMVGRSSLPGLTQLGTLVALGILVAAAIMLVAFLPPLAGRFKATARQAPAGGGLLEILSSSTRMSWALTLAAVTASLLALMGGPPAIDYGTAELGPRAGEARAALGEIEEEIGGFGQSLWLIVPGDDEAQMARRLGETAHLLEQAAGDGLLASFVLPDFLWPQPERQAANRPTAGALAELGGKARLDALEAGFTEEALTLTEAAFAAWRHFAAAEGMALPEGRGAGWIFRQFVARDGEAKRTGSGNEGRFLVLGRLVAAPEASNEELLALAEDLESTVDGRLAGWALLSDSLLGVMERDLERVLLPMIAVLLVLLGLTFRRFGEIALSLLTLGLSVLCLLGTMALFGWSWNLMNLMSLPLLFGAGVDYSIHIQLALRRHRGDVGKVRRTVGKAIFLCGASTAAGFGTLGFASNAGLASMGRVCAAGVLIAALISIFLLPAWWRTMRVRTGDEPFLGDPQ